MREAQFWSKRLRPMLIKECQTLGWRHHFERVENSVNEGTPDVDYCINGIAGKIELKYEPHHPVRPTTPVLGRHKGLRRSQIIWIAKRLHAGGRVFVAIGTPLMTWVIDVRGWTPIALSEIEMKTAQELQEISAWWCAPRGGGTLPHTLSEALVKPRSKP